MLGIIFVLRVSAGIDVGATMILDGVNEGRILLGQSAMCTLRLTDPSVSRRHAALRRDEHAWRLEDLDSTNGTQVNGVRVKEAFLVGGELVTMGGTSFRLTRAGVAALASNERATQFGGFLGRSQEIRNQFAHWARVAGTREPVLIEGEPGTGKELLAEAIHDAGPRASAPFVVLECRGKTEADLLTLIAGTDDGQVQSIFDQANNGTLVIDEPSELTRDAQEVLLARLTSWRGDVRVITTTRRDLDFEVQEGRFSEPLLNRLGANGIELPPLRRRAGDVAFLASRFWQQLGGAGEFPAQEELKLAGGTWPGNVRELLQLVAEILSGRSSSATGESEDALGARGNELPLTSDAITRVIAMELPFVRARQELIREFRRRYVEAVLKKQGGNVSRAAAASGLARRYFQILRAGRR